MSHFFGPVSQIGYVVADFDRAMEYWLNTMGCGPIFVARQVTIRNFRYRGQASDPDLTVGFVQNGAIQVEFIRQNNDAPSSWRDFLAEGPEGLQHVAYWTRMFDDHMAAATAKAGLEPEMTGQSGQEGGLNERFVYFRNSGPRGMMIELSEVVGPKGDNYRRIAEAARDWDGKDPVRYL